MGKEYEDREEYENDGMTESEARRIVEWIVNHGHTKAEAYEALAYVMGATIDD